MGPHMNSTFFLLSQRNPLPNFHLIIKIVTDLLLRGIPNFAPFSKELTMLAISDELDSVGMTAQNMPALKLLQRPRVRIISDDMSFSFPRSSTELQKKRARFKRLKLQLQEQVSLQRNHKTQEFGNILSYRIPLTYKRDLRLLTENK